MASDEEGLLQQGRGGEEEDLQALRSSIGRVSSLLKARKAASQWRHKSKHNASNNSANSDRHGEGENTEVRAQWRLRLGAILESTPTHIVIVVLLLVDLLATAVDLLLTIHNKSSDVAECSSLLQACLCDSSGFSGRTSWEFLHWISVAILGVLLANVFCLMLAFGWSFFKHAGYVLDLVVVTTALVLEVFFEADTAGLLIILNLWRIVRVAHGIFEVTDEAWENEIDDMKERLEATEEAHRRESRWKDQRILELEAELNVIKGLQS